MRCANYLRLCQDTGIAPKWQFSRSSDVASGSLCDSFQRTNIDDDVEMADATDFEEGEIPTPASPTSTTRASQKSPTSTPASQNGYIIIQQTHTTITHTTAALPTTSSPLPTSSQHSTVTDPRGSGPFDTAAPSLLLRLSDPPLTTTPTSTLRAASPPRLLPPPLLHYSLALNTRTFFLETPRSFFCLRDPLLLLPCPCL